MKEQIKRDKCSREKFQDESYDSYIEEDCVSSTPIKIKGRRSVSLLDISDIGSSLEKSKINISSDTIGSNSSLCKDSGYNHSESSLASEKCNDKDDVPFGVELRAKYVRLLDELKYKDVMIAALHQSNHSLRLRIAEAENKISDLRLKSESHCKCCTYRNSVDEGLFESKLPEKKRSETKYSVASLVRNENCVITTPAPLSKSIPPTRHREPTLLPSDDAIIKVQQWQSNSYRECQKRLINQIPPAVSSPPLDPRKIFIRPVPEPISNTLSYMETSRALAETYRKRQDNKAQELVRVQMIGDQSVSVTPIQCAPRQRIVSNKNSCLDSDVSDEKQGNEKDSVLRLQKRHTLFGNLLINHQKSPELDTCLTEAYRMAKDLNLGLSRIPVTLDGIRSTQLI